MLLAAQVLPVEARWRRRWHRRKRRITGALVIKSSTTGARVFVDDDEVGSVPLGRPIKLMPGLHSVKVTKPGHTRFMESVRIRRGRTVRLSVDLFPVKAVLRVRTAPPGARVYVAGKFLGKTPLVDVEVAPGAVRMRIARVGFYDVIRKLSLTAGKATTLVVRLKSLPAAINPLIPKEPPKRWFERWWVWASAAGGLVALITVIAVPVALSQRDPVGDFHPERTYTVPLRTAP